MQVVVVAQKAIVRCEFLHIFAISSSSRHIVKYLKDFLWYSSTLETYSNTSHSAYVATSTEAHGVKINEFLHPNFM